jgi:hypothetical protein
MHCGPRRADSVPSRRINTGHPIKTAKGKLGEAGQKREARNRYAEQASKIVSLQRCVPGCRDLCKDNRLAQRPAPPKLN